MDKPQSAIPNAHSTMDKPQSAIPNPQSAMMQCQMNDGPFLKSPPRIAVESAPSQLSITRE
jgi:hypothetical protein